MISLEKRPAIKSELKVTSVVDDPNKITAMNIPDPIYNSMFGDFNIEYESEKKQPRGGKTGNAKRKARRKAKAARKIRKRNR